MQFHNNFAQCGASILTEGVVLTAAHCVKGLGSFSILMHNIIIISINIVSITIVKSIVISISIKNAKPAEAEQLVVRCGEWNTHHENEPLKHQVKRKMSHQR